MLIADAQVHVWADTTAERPWPARAQPHRVPLGKDELPAETAVSATGLAGRPEPPI